MEACRYHRHVAVLAIHLFLRPLALRINRQPIDGLDGETQYRVWLICRGEDEAHIRALFLQRSACLIDVARPPQGGR
jgi:putative Mg2+ transporter-C (MgtC) family protein